MHAICGAQRRRGRTQMGTRDGMQVRKCGLRAAIAPPGATLLRYQARQVVPCDVGRQDA